MKSFYALGKSSNKSQINLPKHFQIAYEQSVDVNIRINTRLHPPPTCSVRQGATSTFQEQARSTWQKPSARLLPKD